jgi:hypothetical protein
MYVYKRSPSVGTFPRRFRVLERHRGGVVIFQVDSFRLLPVGWHAVRSRSHPGERVASSRRRGGNRAADDDFYALLHLFQNGMNITGQFRLCYADSFHVPIITCCPLYEISSASGNLLRLRSNVPSGRWPALRAISMSIQSENPSAGRFRKWSSADETTSES